MTVSLKKVRERVRGRIRDSDARRDSFGTVETDQAICDAYLSCQSRLPAPELYTPNALTIAAGGDTFALPANVAGYATAEYAGEIRLQLVSTGNFLIKCRVEEIDALRNFVPTATVFCSIPYRFATYEDASQVIRGRCYPGAKASEVCNLFASMAADDMRDAADLDTVNVLFSRYAAQALAILASADLVDRMSAKEIALRDLNPNVAKAWRAEGETLLYAEECRRLDLEGTGRIERWVP